MEKGQRQGGQGKIEKHLNFDLNLKEAHLLAEKHDPFRQPEVQSKYNPMEHNVFQIKPSDTYVMFTLIKAKSKNGHSKAYPVNYNQSNYDFTEDFFRALGYFKQLID